MRVTVQSRLGQRLQDRETLIGSSPRAARRRHGIELRGRAVEASGTEIRFADGSALSPKAVIWATGFALDHSFVQAPVFDENGRVEHRRGVTAVPGLYFLGLPWQHTRGSALLGWVKDDAQYIASEIARAATAGLRAAGRPRGRLAPGDARSPAKAGLRSVRVSRCWSGGDRVVCVVGVAGVLVDAQQHRDEHAEQHRDVLEAHQGAEARGHRRRAGRWRRGSG